MSPQRSPRSYGPDDLVLNRFDEEPFAHRGLRDFEEINKQADKQAKTMPILLEVNLAGESTKFGFKAEEVLANLDAINALPKIEIHGLMMIAPWTPESEKVRPVFRQLRELKTQCEERLGAPLPHLSMGMSGDFEVAIEEGSTLVRIGTALFGDRPPRATAAETDPNGD